MKYIFFQFLHDALYIGFSSIFPKSILQSILVVCACKGFQLFVNFMCYVTHHKPFNSRLKAVNEVRKRIVIIIP